MQTLVQTIGGRWGEGEGGYGEGEEGEEECAGARIFRKTGTCVLALNTAKFRVPRAGGGVAVRGRLRGGGGGGGVPVAVRAGSR